MSVVLAISSTDPVERQWAVDLLITAYWKPTYKYIRMKWQLAHEAAKDLTKAFLNRAIGDGFFRSFNPAATSLRVFVRNAIDRFMTECRDLAARLTRVNELHDRPLDFDAAQSEMGPPASNVTTIEEYFEREWVHSLFAMAIDSLEQECRMHGRTLHFRIFEQADLDDPQSSVDDLAAQFQLAATDVADHLAKVRRQLRTIILENLRLLTGSEIEFRNELHVLLGA